MCTVHSETVDSMCFHSHHQILIRGGGYQMNKFEQFSSDDNQMSLVGVLGLEESRFDAQRGGSGAWARGSQVCHLGSGLGLGACTVRSNASWVTSLQLHWRAVITQCEIISQFFLVMLCYAVACPHLERSGMSTACPRSASAHLYHADGRLTSCDGAATDCI